MTLKKKMNLLFTIKNIFEILQTLFKEERDFDNHGTNALKVTVFQFLLARTCTLFVYHVDYTSRYSFNLR